MHQLRPDPRAGPRDVFRARGVDRVSPVPVAFGVVDGGVGRAVDHHVAGLHDLAGALRIGDVPLRRRQRQHVASLPGRLGRQKAADLPAGPCDHNSLCHGCKSGTPRLGYPSYGCYASNLM